MACVVMTAPTSVSMRTPPSVSYTHLEGDKVDVVGTSKGKGYQGVIKRFGQHRLRESHGTGPVARHAGSNGSTSTPVSYTHLI